MKKKITALILALALIAALPLTAFAAVAPPTDLKATIVTSGISLTWKDNSSDEDMFSVYRTEDGGLNWKLIKSVAKNQTSFLDDAVQEGKIYIYKVRAVVVGGNVADSNEVVAVFIKAPTNLTATADAAGISLKWTDNSTVESGYKVERKEGGGAWVEINADNIAANTTTYADTTAQEGKTYTYRVRAWRDYAYSPDYSGYSNEVTATISLIAAPTNLTATAGVNSITLNWKDNSDNETHFIIERREEGEGWGQMDSVGANITTFTDTLVLPGKTYTYKVNAVKEGTPISSSPYSNEVTVTFGIAPPKPVASMDNFKLINTYTSGQFTDVNEDAWYGYNDQRVIATAYNYGLMKGTSTTTFKPAGNFTIAEAVTVAARVHSIYWTGKEDFVNGNPWYQNYVDYAVKNGIIKATDFTNYNAPATRAQMAYIFAHCLPDSCFPDRDGVKTPPDVNTSTPYFGDILKLYNAGIVGGSDDKGTFRPDSNIIRAEAAAIIARVILPGIRLGWLS